MQISNDEWSWHRFGGNLFHGNWKIIHVIFICIYIYHVISFHAILRNKIYIDLGWHFDSSVFVWISVQDTVVSDTLGDGSIWVAGQCLVTSQVPKLVTSQVTSKGWWWKFMASRGKWSKNWYRSLCCCQFSSNRRRTSWYWYWLLYNDSVSTNPSSEWHVGNSATPGVSKKATPESVKWWKSLQSASFCATKYIQWPYLTQ